MYITYYLIKWLIRIKKAENQKNLHYWTASPLLPLILTAVKIKFIVLVSFTLYYIGNHTNGYMNKYIYINTYV